MAPRNALIFASGVRSRFAPHFDGRTRAPDQTRKFTDLTGGGEIERTEAAKETSSSLLGFARVRRNQTKCEHCKAHAVM
jgi:hypothetical protein